MAKIDMKWVSGLVSALSNKADTTAIPSLSGMIIQTVRGEVLASSTSTAQIPNDDTKPQLTEGTEFITLAFTPKRADSTLEIEVHLNVSYNVAATIIGALFVDSTADAIAAGRAGLPADYAGVIRFVCRVPATSVTLRTYRVRAGANAAGTLTVNGGAGVRVLGGVLSSYITVREIQA